MDKVMSERCKNPPKGGNSLLQSENQALVGKALKATEKIVGMMPALREEAVATLAFIVECNRDEGNVRKAAEILGGMGKGAAGAKAALEARLGTEIGAETKRTIESALKKIGQ